MLARLKDLLGLGSSGLKTPLELHVDDQWVLKYLLDVKRPAAEAEIIAAVLLERPWLLPEELGASLFKLRLAGVLQREPDGRFAVTPGARKLRGILPERPAVNMTYYG